MKGRSWSRKEVALLRKMWPECATAEIAGALGRSAVAVKSRASLLRLKRKKGHRPWLASETKRLRAIYADRSTVEVAKILGLPLSRVNARAHKLRLHKSAAYLASPAACRLRRGDHCGKAYWFPKGHVPANKGLRRPGWTRGRMSETQFKKGHRPHTWVPVGTVAMNTDGYLRRKIADHPGNGTGANSKNWEFVHKRVWEDAHGPIPKGHRIWWKDGNHENCALENLELLSDKEHMARTTIHRLPKELKDTIMLAGALKRRIRRMERGTRHQGAAEASV